MGISLRRDAEINLDGWHLFGFYRLISGCQSTALDVESTLWMAHTTTA